MRRLRLRQAFGASSHALCYKKNMKPVDVLRERWPELKAQGAVGILGDLALDHFVFGTVDRISPEAPVPVLKKESEVLKLGCSANVVANIVSYSKPWSVDVKVFGVLGKDETSLKLQELFSKMDHSIDFHWIEDPTRRTPLKTRYIAGAQHQMLRVDEEDVESLEKTVEEKLLEQLRASLKDLSVLIVQDYAKGTCTQSLLAKILPEARAAQVKVLVDPNKKTPLEWYKDAWTMTPNVDEAEVLVGKDLLRGQNSELVQEAVQILKERLNLKESMITRGKYGMSLMDENGKAFHLPAQARQVFDVTGAGDTVIATLGAALAVSLPFSSAAQLSNLAASLVVSQVGTARVDFASLEKLLFS